MLRDAICRLSTCTTGRRGTFRIAACRCSHRRRTRSVHPVRNTSSVHMRCRPCSRLCCCPCRRRGCTAGRRRMFRTAGRHCSHRRQPRTRPSARNTSSVHTRCCRRQRCIAGRRGTLRIAGGHHSPSEAAPHVTLWAAHVLGVHVPVAQTPEMHDWPEGHAPHCWTLPQPSEAAPHVTLCAEHVLGVHAGALQRPEVHDWPEGHAPHRRRPPPPSEAAPHVTLCAAHVLGVHALCACAVRGASAANAITAGLSEMCC